MAERPFVLPLIPPNLTGDLHLGHALMATVQDAIVRSVRQRGREAVFVPGVDHAGIGMYALVRAETGFLPDRPVAERLAAWAGHHHRVIDEQFRSLLLACDWDLEVYTLDPRYVEMVHWAFRTLAARDLVYRGHRLVHWCPTCRTALSDMECDATEGPRPVAVVPVRLGARLHLVETPRPELLWAAVALAVPGGEAAAGTPTVPSPAGGAPLPVIDAGEPGAKPWFVVPAHDARDLDLARAAGLPVREVLGDDGRSLVDGAPGVDRAELRRWTIEQLRLRTTGRPVVVATCGRCDTELVDRVSWQWFVRMRPLVAPVLEALRVGEIAITPEPVRRQALDWLAKAEDWCVSRQIPWGQVVPARRCTAPDCGGFTVDGDGPCPACGAPTEPETDVFDTWFSSSLWPLGTAGWPDEAEIARRYPATLMTSGRDILFFLFVRLLSLGRELTGTFPVRHCHFHGMVLDEHGRKMSKSRGNTVTVKDAVAAHGPDVLRTALLAGCHGADDLRMVPGLFTRAARVQAAFTDLAGLGVTAEADGLDHWCAARAGDAAAELAAALDGLRFSAAARAVDRFATGPLARYVATRRRLGAPAHQAVVAAAGRLVEPLMPDVAAELARLVAGATGDEDGAGSGPGRAGWSPDGERAAAAGAVLAAVDELEVLRGAVGVPTTQPVGLTIGGRGALAAGERWVPATTRLALDAAPEPAAGVPWRLPAQPEATLWLPAAAAPRLRQEAARRLRHLSDRRRSLAARLAEAEAGDGPAATGAAAGLATRLATVTTRIGILRENAAAAAAAAEDVAEPTPA